MVWVKLMMAQSIVLGKVLCYTLYVPQGPSWQSRFLKLTMIDESQILLKCSSDMMRLDILCYYNQVLCFCYPLVSIKKKNNFAMRNPVVPTTGKNISDAVFGSDES